VGGDDNGRPKAREAQETTRVATEVTSDDKSLHRFCVRSLECVQPPAAAALVFGFMPELKSPAAPPRRRRTDIDRDADHRRGYRRIAEASYALFQQRGSDPEQVMACWHDATRIVLGPEQPRERLHATRILDD
jgi:hypothetical protein